MLQPWMKHVPPMQHVYVSLISGCNRLQDENLACVGDYCVLAVGTCAQATECSGPINVKLTSGCTNGKCQYKLKTGTTCPADSVEFDDAVTVTCELGECVASDDDATVKYCFLFCAFTFFQGLRRCLFFFWDRCSRLCSDCYCPLNNYERYE